MRKPIALGIFSTVPIYCSSKRFSDNYYLLLNMANPRRAFDKMASIFTKEDAAKAVGISITRRLMYLL
jgi:hypothetical protein